MSIEDRYEFTFSESRLFHVEQLGETDIIRLTFIDNSYYQQ